jgi:hypothetical protein
MIVAGQEVFVLGDKTLYRRVRELTGLNLAVRFHFCQLFGNSGFELEFNFFGGFFELKIVTHTGQLSFA